MLNERQKQHLKGKLPLQTPVLSAVRAFWSLIKPRWHIRVNKVLRESEWMRKMAAVKAVGRPRNNMNTEYHRWILSDHSLLLSEKCLNIPCNLLLKPQSH